MNPHFFFTLAEKYLSNTASAAERQLVEGYFDLLAQPESPLSEEMKTRVKAEIKKNIEARKDIPVIETSYITPSPRTRTIRRWTIAASIIALLGLALYVVTLSLPKRNPQTEKTITSNDIKAPELNRAMITLADGRKVYLDSVNAGQLALQQNIKLIKTTDGQLIYDHDVTLSPELVEGSKGDQAEVYNTLSNPRGSKVIDMKLSDGSHVWLNAGSSITYPVAFVGNERKVTMTGEAYFEITRNPSQPFRVAMNPPPGGQGGPQVEVLGTHFNVNAYDDENDIKVTLLEGSVEVKNKNSKIRIIPGEQARIPDPASRISVSQPDLDQVMAWKNNEFIFTDNSLEDIMRQLSRWYNINPVFPSQSATANTTNYTGRITRTVPISQVLAMFEKLGYVKFEINGNEVRIIPIK